MGIASGRNDSSKEAEKSHTIHIINYVFKDYLSDLAICEKKNLIKFGLRNMI